MIPLQTNSQHLTVSANKVIKNSQRGKRLRDRGPQTNYS